MSIETLMAIYEERQNTYHRLCDACEAANKAANDLKALCDAAMKNMHDAGAELMNAMKK